ncbi:hypothetical protein FA13DRAFT_1789553 [Coprinellus micaceus]|uniref:Pali-domain-containing protein n=1 Tax=Coprinellus micaceus TaxID=71717 RepID=A0A4Y7TIA8_COPMI|nr:hypothetical protein FA13DRAFT_1789553 [Coprinellus micaceus]
MISQLPWSPSSVLLAVALFLSFLVTVSLPTIPFMDAVRVSSKEGFSVPGRDVNSTEVFTEIRYGIWSICSWNLEGGKVCHSQTSELPFSMKASSPLATASILGALAASLSLTPAIANHAALVCTVSTALALFSFFYVQVWFYSAIRDLFSRGFHGFPKDPSVVHAGPGLWTGFAVLVLMTTASILSCVKRRRRRLAAEAGHAMEF